MWKAFVRIVIYGARHYISCPKVSFYTLKTFRKTTISYVSTHLVLLSPDEQIIESQRRFWSICCQVLSPSLCTLCKWFNFGALSLHICTVRNLEQLKEIPLQFYSWDYHLRFKMFSTKDIIHLVSHCPVYHIFKMFSTKDIIHLTSHYCFAAQSSLFKLVHSSDVIQWKSSCYICLSVTQFPA